MSVIDKLARGLKRRARKARKEAVKTREYASHVEDDHGLCKDAEIYRAEADIHDRYAAWLEQLAKKL